jgi:hypothetical protein
VRAAIPAPGDFGVFGRLDAGDSDCRDHLAVDDDGHATFEQSLQGRGHQCRAALIDGLFEALGLTTAQSGRGRFGQCHLRGKGRGTIQTLDAQDVSPVITHTDADRPVLGAGMGGCGIDDTPTIVLDKVALRLHHDDPLVRVMIAGFRWPEGSPEARQLSASEPRRSA